MLPEVSIRKKITRLFLDTPVALSGSSSKSSILSFEAELDATVSAGSKSSSGEAD